MRSPFVISINRVKYEITYQIPGLSFLIDKINHAPLNPQVKGNLLSLIYPIGTTRTYYKINDGDMDQNLRQEILKEYQRLTGEDVSKIVLFAMTNGRGETFLLPEFFKLTELQKAVMLFHESMWNLQVDISYPDMVNLEMATEAYFNAPTDPQIFFNFFDLLGRMLSLKKPTPEVLLQSAFYYTFLLHPPEHPQVETVLLSKVFDFDFLNCYRENQGSGAGQDLADCSKMLQTQLMTSPPQTLNMFDRAILSVLNDGGFKGFLCFTQDYQDRHDQSLFDKDVYAWMNKAAFQTDGPLWQADENMPITYAPYTAASKIFKISEGPVRWGALAVCYAPLFGM